MIDPNSQQPQAAQPLLPPRAATTPPWWSSLYELPPVGTAQPGDEAFFAELRTRLATEARNERNKWIPMRDASICIFNNGEYPQPPDSKFVENFIQGDVQGAKSIMLGEPPAIEVGVEDDGSTVLAWFWDGPQVIKELGIDPLTGQQGVSEIPVQQLGVPPDAQDPITGESVAQPIDEQTAGILQQMGYEKYLAPIDNKAMGDVYQLAHDRFWRKAKTNQYVDQFLTGTLKGGWDTGLYEWDSELGHIHTNIPVVNVFADPTRQFVWDFQHCQIHRVYRLRDAQRKFPEYAKLLFDRSQTGQPKRVDDQTDMGYQYNRDFQSRTVTLSILWLADQPKPMTMEEALAGGHVEQVHFEEFVPPGQPLPGQEPTSEDQSSNPQDGDEGNDSVGISAGSGDVVGRDVHAGDSDSATSGAGSDVAQDATGTDEGTGQIENAATPAPQAPQAPPIVPTQLRPALVLHGTDDEVTPDHPKWPMRLVLRQTIMLDSDILIEDEESPFPKMNLIHATCIPNEDLPYGWSIPWKSRHAQKADSMMANSIANNCRAHGNPPQYMSSEMKARLEQETKRASIDPDLILSLDDNDFTDQGKPKAGFIDLPQLNEHHIAGRAQMQADRKELGGYTDAAKGVPVTANASGELQKVTMSAASGVIGSISEHFQGAVQHLAELHLYSLTHFASVQQIAECCRRYRREVIAAIHLNLAPQAAWKVDVLLASAAGQRRQQKIDRLIALNAQIDPTTGFPIVDAETLQEAMNLDPAQIRERNMRALKEKMGLMQQMAPPAVTPGQEEEPGAESPQPNQSSQQQQPAPVGA